MDGPVNATFSHEPLPDSATHIRLLEILQGDFERHVSCRLSIWPVDNTPNYDAISYTWGESASPTSITINGKQITVRRNCEYALRQIFAASATEQSNYIWLDTLCIDQDNTQEKNRQVAMMGQIYKQAAHVHACVGPPADDSGYMFEVVRAQKHMLRRFDVQPSSRVDAFVSPYPDTWSISRSTTLEILSSLIMGARARDRLLRSFFAFIERPYFQRVWILQELYLASEVIFHCGSDKAPGDRLVPLSQLIEYWSSLGNDRVPVWATSLFKLFDRKTRRLLCRKRRKACKFGFDYLLSNDTWRTRFACFKLASRCDAPFGLSYIMQYMTEFECADPRDKFYGILNLIDGSHGFNVAMPDYGKDTFAIVADLLELDLPYDEVPLQWAFNLSRLLKVPVNPERFEQAWRQPRRPRLPVDTRANRRVTTWDGGCRTGIPDFFICEHRLAGVRIRAWNDRFSPGSNLFISRASVGDYTRIVDKDGELVAYGPSEIQAGDWHLGADIYVMQGNMQCVGLISRDTGDHHLRIVAVTSYRQDLTKRMPQWSKGFNIHWHPLELQVLATVLANVDFEAKDQQPLSRLLHNRSLVSLESSLVTARVE